MKWYDYSACFLFADFISSGLFSGNLLVLGMGVFGYDLYEGWRKQVIE